MTVNGLKHVVCACAALALLVAAPTPARAQNFIAPFIGYNFGGDAKCPEITDCKDKALNGGVTLGKMGAVFGFEEEFAFARDFFGDAPGLSSSVLTVTSNLIVSPSLRPIRPYFVTGVGLIRTNVELNANSILTSGNNSWGYDIGGGVIIGSKHVGVRGDIRYFHAFEDLELLGVTVKDNSPLDFGRASVGLYLGF